jgi:hypothetical protein
MGCIHIKVLLAKHELCLGVAYTFVLVKPIIFWLWDAAVQHYRFPLRRVRISVCGSMLRAVPWAARRCISEKLQEADPDPA